MARYSVKLRWKVSAILDSDPPVNRDNVVFNFSPNTGLYSQFSIPLWQSYVPQLLSPTVTYHQTIRNLLKKALGIDLVERKFPYRVYVPAIGSDVLLNIQARLFLPNILSLTVKLSDIPTQDLDAIRLIDYQRLDYMRPVSDIVQWTIGMVETLDNRLFNPSHPLRYKPALHIDGVCPAEYFDAHIRDHLIEYVGILIRNYDYQLMADRIPEGVFKKNQEHNVKSLEELLLIDKQGVMYITPTKTTARKPQRPRFSRTYELYGLALMLNDLLQNYHSMRLRNENLTDFMMYKMRPWIEEPDSVFSASVSNTFRWSLLLEEFKLRPRLRAALTPVTLGALEEKRKYFDQFDTNWWDDPDFASVIAAKVIESDDLPLDFIEDQDFRRMILADFNEAQRSFRSRSYKSTLVLCGSVAEAMLTAVLEKASIPGMTKEKLYSAGLYELADHAKKHSLVSDTAIYSLLDPLRFYRNAIHPGKQLRMSISPDEHKAKIALETVTLLSKDLGRRK